MTALSSDLREALAKVGTSTLTGVLNRRGLKSMTLYDVWPIRPEQPAMVGIAFTMRFIPSREDKDGPTSTNRSTVPVALVFGRRSPRDPRPPGARPDHPNATTWRAGGQAGRRAAGL